MPNNKNTRSTGELMQGLGNNLTPSTCSFLPRRCSPNVSKNLDRARWSWKVCLRTCGRSFPNLPFLWYRTSVYAPVLSGYSLDGKTPITGWTNCLNTSSILFFNSAHCLFRQTCNGSMPAFLQCT